MKAEEIEEIQGLRAFEGLEGLIDLSQFNEAFRAELPACQRVISLVAPDNHASVRTDHHLVQGKARTV